MSVLTGLLGGGVTAMQQEYKRIDDNLEQRAKEAFESRMQSDRFAQQDKLQSERIGANTAATELALTERRADRDELRSWNTSQVPIEAKQSLDYSQKVADQEQQNKVKNAPANSKMAVDQAVAVKEAERQFKAVKQGSDERGAYEEDYYGHKVYFKDTGDGVWQNVYGADGKTVVNQINSKTKAYKWSPRDKGGSSSEAKSKPVDLSKLKIETIQLDGQDYDYEPVSGYTIDITGELSKPLLDNDSAIEQATKLADGGFMGGGYKPEDHGGMERDAFIQVTADQLIAEAGTLGGDRRVARSLSDIPMYQQPASSNGGLLDSSPQKQQKTGAPTVNGVTLAPDESNNWNAVIAGNIDLDAIPVLDNGDGSFSTVRSFSIGTDQGELLLPLIVDGKVRTKEEAIDSFRKTGKHLGVYSSPEAATVASKAISKRQDVRRDEVGRSKSSGLVTDKKELNKRGTTETNVEATPPVDADIASSEALLKEAGIELPTHKKSVYEESNVMKVVTDFAKEAAQSSRTIQIFNHYTNAGIDLAKDAMTHLSDQASNRARGKNTRKLNESWNKIVTASKEFLTGKKTKAGALAVQLNDNMSEKQKSIAEAWLVLDKQANPYNYH